MNEKQFIETYCGKCGTQRCEGPGSEWFEGCQKRWNLDGVDAATEIKRLNDKVMELGYKIIELTPKQGMWSVIDRTEYGLEAKCSECGYEMIFGRCQIGRYCPNCGAKMDGGEPTTKNYPRCHKCIHELVCVRNSDNEGLCHAYKRDPKDGGYYG